MNEDFFPVQLSLLSSSALAEWLSVTYSLPAAPICNFWSRSINDTYLITSGEQKFFLRISPADWRSYDNLTAELELLYFLKQSSFSVPQPIKQKNGTTIQTLKAPEGPRHAVVFDFVPGNAPAPLTETDSYHYGQAIARLHTLTNNYPINCSHPRFDLENMLDEPLARLKPWFNKHQDDFADLENISASLKQIAAALTKTAPYYGICHGDVHRGNIHFDEDQGWTLIDCEYAGYGWRVFDIGNFILTLVNQMDKTEQTKNIRTAFLKGYQALRPLSALELEVLPAFVILRQIWMLGITARLSSNLGLEMVQGWIFDRCVPFIKAWTMEPW